MDRIPRRKFMVRVAVPVALFSIRPRLAQGAGLLAIRRMPSQGPQPVPVSLTVNGRKVDLLLEPRETLLDTLRDKLSLTGTKKGCDQATCGACTVLVDGRRVNSCFTLAIMAQGKAITTIEGLAQGETLHPVQRAFLEHDAFQCGFCTPGQIMSAVGLIAEHRPVDDPNVREWMSGNICRCGAYANIAAAVQSAAGAGA